MVIGREGLNANELANHNTCRLGKWYNAVTEAGYKNHPAYAQLLEPHRLVHEHGIEAVKCYNSGDVAGALARIEKVEAASKNVLALLAQMETVSA